MKIAILTAGDASKAAGGAERLNRALVETFRDMGHSVDAISVPHRENSVDEIISNYEKTAALDLSRYDLVVSGKAPTYAVNHPNHLVYLVHTVRVFDDMFDENFAMKWRDLFTQRQQIHALDFAGLEGASRHFAIGHEVEERLWRYRGLRAQVIHPPMELSTFTPGAYGDYLFIASRLHPWKRIDLSVRALVDSDLDLRLLIAGEGEAEEELKALARGDSRVEFLGRISDDALLRYYTGALAVPFTPIREDYGYATLEAFASAKAVITTKDAGEPCRFVEHEINGLICDPTPESLRGAFARLKDRGFAEQLGRAGLGVVEELNWKRVGKTLLDAAAEGATPKSASPIKVLVTDMQPITPPVGGGRLRLLGLYHGMLPAADCTYVGTYDWPGEAHRDNQITEGLREILVPLTDEHHAIAQRQAAEANGKNVIDLLFSRTAQASPDFIAEVRKQIRTADVVIFSHPWVYPLVKDHLRPFQTVIYDSQNVESYLRAQLFDPNDAAEREVLKSVIEDERAICEAADWVFACSDADLARFHRLFGTPYEKLRVVPNGVMAFDPSLRSKISKAKTRDALGLPKQMSAIFIGSEYGPNVDAAAFINDTIAPLQPNVTFVIAGGVSETISKPASNVVLTGRLDDQQRSDYFRACDFAINPMLSGSGTNIKMFDFMASGLPIVSTAIGARGIEDPTGSFMIVCEPTPASFTNAIKTLQDQKRRTAMGEAARSSVRRRFAWENISKAVGAFCAARKKMGKHNRPLFSVIVPTFERHDKLFNLLQGLSKQVERDFEVIVVDQSGKEWSEKDTSFGFPLTYFHTDVRGAISARNTGAFLAQGDILAFIDDDCLPSRDWLLNSRNYFCDAELVGVEGRIDSDRPGDEEWREVSNVGFEGIGFMTANLLVRSSSFQQLGGFDLRFDDPHFREDTDFGWRLSDLGKVSYANDVRVLHPAQPRSDERESVETRSKFFEKDALLYQKHPDRYRDLFFRECQWTHNPHFAVNLMRGFERVGILEQDTPAWMQDTLKDFNRQ